jgi:REP element-mobilizing transposase RayT
VYLYRLRRHCIPSPGCLLRAPPLLPGPPGSYEPIINLNLLDNDIINFLKSICSEIGERYCFEFDAIGCDGDHVHLFVGAEPKNSPSRVMQIIKNITARKIFKEYRIKKQLWNGELWSDGDTLEQWETEQHPMLLKIMFKTREIRMKRALR